MFLFSLGVQFPGALLARNLPHLLWLTSKHRPLGNRQSTVSGALLRKRALTKFCGKLGEFCEKLGEFALIGQQTRVYPHPLVAGAARPNPKMGAPDPENPLFLGFSVLRGGPRPWSRKGPDHGVGVDLETVNRVFLNLGFAKPMFSNSVLFTKTTGITKITKMTKTTQTATSKGVDCWICRNHGKHGDDENHENPECKT